MTKLIKLADIIAKHMQDPEFRAAWDEADAEYQVIEEMIRARTAAGLTQAELGQRIGTTQSAIARLEGGRVSPSVATLRKFAAATGRKLRIEMVE